MVEPLPADETTVEAMAAHYGCSTRTIRRAVIAAGVHPIGRGPAARLTSADVLLIREALRRCPTRSQDSPALGTSPANASAAGPSSGAASFPTGSGPSSSPMRRIGRALKRISGRRSSGVDDAAGCRVAPAPSGQPLGKWQFGNELRAHAGVVFRRKRSQGFFSHAGLLHRSNWSGAAGRCERSVVPL